MHEYVHILVAGKLGYTLLKFELSITGASMKLEDESFYGNDELIIALSGPLFNLFMFIMIVGLWWMFPVLYNYTFDFALVNLFVFALNILPIYSLDGGRIIVCLLESKMGRKKGVKIVRNIGLFFSLFFFVLFIISLFISPNFSLGVISIFLFVSCSNVGKTEIVKISVLSKKEKIKNGISLEIKTYIFSSSARLIELYRKLRHNTFTSFHVVSSDNKQLCFDEDELICMLEKYGASVKLCDAIA